MSTQPPDRLLIAVAGPMGSGKSSIARALADHLSGERRSYGDAVRREATRHGLPQSRAGLQDLGDVLITEGWAEFTALLLQTVDPAVDVLVVDGVRHVDALDHLARSSGKRAMVSVYVSTMAANRIQRLAARDGLPPAKIEQAMTHPNEHEVEGLIELVDLIVGNDQPVDLAELVQRIREVSSDR